jgi:hypothetical protein
MDITVTLTLSPEQAAGLKRFAEKITHDDALAVLYPHVASELRSDQAYTILNAFARLETALADAGARSWPWIESGVAS